MTLELWKITKEKKIESQEDETLTELIKKETIKSVCYQYDLATILIKTIANKLKVMIKNTINLLKICRKVEIADNKVYDAYSIEIEDKYKREVSRMENEVNKEVESINENMSFKTFKTHKDTIFDMVRKSYNGVNGRFYKVMTAMLLFAPIIFYWIYISSLPKPLEYDESQKVEYTGTVIDVKMNKNNMLDFIPKHLTVKQGDNRYAEIDESIIKDFDATDLNVTDNKFKLDDTEYEVDTKMELNNLDCYNDYMLAVYRNQSNTAQRIIIYSSQNYSQLGLDLNDMQSVEGDVFEKNNQLSVSAYKQSYDNSTLYYAEEIAGGTLGTKTLQSRVKKIEDNMKYSELNEGDTENVTINFDELGTLELNKLSALKSAPGVYFDTSTQDVLRIYNYKEDIPYIFVTYVNHPSFMCNESDLIETNQQGLYVVDGFSDSESVGYRTFAIATKNNLYAFRIDAKATDDLVEEVLNQFGYTTEGLTIKKVQSVVDVNAEAKELEQIDDTEETTGTDEETVESTEETVENQDESSSSVEE